MQSLLSDTVDRTCLSTPTHPHISIFLSADLQGMDYFRLRFPFPTAPGQEHLADDGDTTHRQAEAADAQAKEHSSTADSAHHGPNKTSLSETQ